MTLREKLQELAQQHSYCGPIELTLEESYWCHTKLVANCAAFTWKHSLNWHAEKAFRKRVPIQVVSKKDGSISSLY